MHLGYLVHFPLLFVVHAALRTDSVVEFGVGQRFAVVAAEEDEDAVVALMDAVGVYQTAYQCLVRCVDQMANLLEGTSEA